MEPDISQLDQGPGIGEYLGVLRRRRLLILFPFLIVVGLAVLLGFALPPRYMAETQFKIQDFADLDQFYDQVGVSIPHKPLFSAVTMEIKRRTFLDPIVRELGMYEGYDYHDAQERQDLFTHIIENLDVRYIKQKEGPDIVGISFEGRDPRKVAAFVNMVRSVYLDDVRTRYLNGIATVRSQLLEAFNKAKASHQTAVADYRKFQEGVDFQLLGNKTLYDKRQELAEARARIEGESNAKRGDQETLDRIRADLRLIDPFTEETERKSDPAYVAQQDLVRASEKQLEGLLQKYTDFYPPVIDAKAALRLARDKLATMDAFQESSVVRKANPKYEQLDTQARLLEGEIGGAGVRVQSLRARITALETQVDRIPELNATNERLQIAKDQAEFNLTRYTKALGRAQAAYERAIDPANDFVAVLDAPIEEEAMAWDPVFPNVGLFIAAGLVMGLLLGVGVAFMAEFTSQAYATPQQVRRGLGLPIIGGVGEVITEAERRRRLVRSVITWTITIAILALLVWAHVYYFDEDLQGDLPPWVFDIMKRIYGSR